MRRGDLVTVLRRMSGTCGTLGDRDMSKLREMQERKEQQQESYYRAVVQGSSGGEKQEAERPTFGTVAVRYKGRIRIRHS